jgi:heme-degrading monooxygenase HmoA
MPALVTITVPLDITVYEQMSAGLAPHLATAPGFRAHGAYPVEGGFVVTEIWDSAAEHEAFFDAAIKPHLADGASVKVIELRNAIVGGQR